MILWYKSRYPGVRVLLAKKDVSEAFKWLWVEQDDCRLFGADVPHEANDPADRGAVSRPVTVLYLAMTFGWMGAPGEFMAFAWASAFRSLALMDDSVVIEPDFGLRPQLSMEALEEAIRQTLGPLAINAAKDIEEGTLTTRKLIWGLEGGTCRLPPLKVERAYHILQSPHFNAGQRIVPLKEVQVLRGCQQFWLGVLPQLAPYLQSTNALLGPADKDGNVVFGGSETEQANQWEAFWGAIELQRLLVGSRQFWEARFVSLLERALTTPELLALPEVKRNLVWVSADATPTRLGAIDWTSKVALACEASPLLRPLETKEAERSSPEAHSEPGEDLVQIGVAELLALLVLVVARKEAWTGSVVLYLGDNTNVQDGSKSVKQVMLRPTCCSRSLERWRACTAYRSGGPISGRTTTRPPTTSLASIRKKLSPVRAFPELKCLPIGASSWKRPGTGGPCCGWVNPIPTDKSRCSLQPGVWDRPPHELCRPMDGRSTSLAQRRLEFIILGPSSPRAASCTILKRLTGQSYCASRR